MNNFDEFYFDIWGERWASLKESLLVEKNYMTLSSKNGNVYHLDLASLNVASYLDVLDGEDILDMCAAPGGKSLVMLNYLTKYDSFWANDKERSDRLRRTIRSFYPEENIKMTGFDGSLMGQKCLKRFDAVLVDAPCSSEWHWLKSGDLMEHWRPSRSKRLALQAYSLLASACILLKPGGRCLYVTCAVNSVENENVIDKLISRWGDKISVDNHLPFFAEKARHGFYCLPDRGFGGPLYACLIKRNNII